MDYKMDLSKAEAKMKPLKRANPKKTFDVSIPKPSRVQMRHRAYQEKLLRLHSLAQLRNLVKSYNLENTIKNYSKMKKNEIIDAMFDKGIEAVMKGKKVLKPKPQAPVAKPSGKKRITPTLVQGGQPAKKMATNLSQGQMKTLALLQDLEKRAAQMDKEDTKLIPK